jgi:endonuclease/exonuclease/phosphatase family metal-dependent hydrolase
MRRDTVIVIVLLLLITSTCTPVRRAYNNPEGPKFVGMMATEPLDFDGEVKVVTYNVKLGKNVEQAIQELANEPELRDADVIFLQEMDPKGVNDIAHQFQYNFVYYPAALHSTHEKDFGNAILTKWPVKSYEKLILPHEHPIRKMYRIAVFALLEMGEFEVLTCCVHTEIYILGHEKKLEQVEAVVDHIQDRYPYVIVGGDFNTDIEYQIEEMERVFGDSGFVRATKGIGATQQIDPLGLIKFEFDHIFVRGFEVLRAGKVKEAKASDHIPVWSVLQLKK